MNTNNSVNIFGPLLFKIVLKFCAFMKIPERMEEMGLSGTWQKMLPPEFWVKISF